ncbi:MULTISPECIES: restriction endonuclease subunit S [Fibrobacter]|uniref:restriction endonuclease subunit S n=1 Tax=Fibrobacter TaxID=832 RepID=UPI000B51E93B|nr:MULTISPECIES: restriction endonuclease subunit S [Fibrobacter]
MSEWKKVKIGEFLTEREGRFKPDDKRISKYQRLDKIDFSGNIHLSNKPTKTDMILVQPGDLVISGINVAKGAITVYQGEEPVCATIHYSSYTFDSSKVDLGYFKFFVKSAAFIAAMQKQVKGSIKTEIKSKHLLALEISIPDLQTQKKIVKEISSQLDKTEQLSIEIAKQKSYAKQLRQNILQEAIEGKLTADWRKQHPVQKGNPDYDAEALFEKIQAEKSETKSSKKTVAPITKDEIPFEIPAGWKWVRLGDISLFSSAGKSFNCESREAIGDEWGIIKTSAITSGVFVESENKFYSKKCNNDVQTKIQMGDFLFCRASGSKGLAGRSCVVEKISSNLLLSDKSIRIELAQGISKSLVNMLNNSQYGENYRLSLGTNKSTSMNNLTREQILNFRIPLPPTAEQKEIVARVEQHLQTITQLETQIATRETTTKQLMQSILKDAFGEGIDG